MPLNTAIYRDGKPLTLRWGGFHLAAMVCAVSWDSGKGPFVDNSEPAMVTHEVDGKEVTGHFISPRNCFELGDYGMIGCTPLGHDAYTLQRNFTFVRLT